MLGCVGFVHFNHFRSALSKLGETVSARNLLDIRTDLAIHDEHYMKEIARNSHIAIVIDNMDREVRGALVHKTLPLLLCQNTIDSISFLNNERKSLGETLSKFKPDYFQMNSSSNVEEKKSFLQVLLACIL